MWWEELILAYLFFAVLSNSKKYPLLEILHISLKIISKFLGGMCSQIEYPIDKSKKLFSKLNFVLSETKRLTLSDDRYFFAYSICVLLMSDP